MINISNRSSVLVSNLIAGFALVATATILGLPQSATAGEAGAAGSAAFTIDSSSKVTGAAVAAATGKNGAAAGSYNTTTGNSAYSLGSGGVITITTEATSGVVDQIKDAVDATPATAQTNTLSDAVNINATTGIVTAP